MARRQRKAELTVVDSNEAQNKLPAQRSITLRDEVRESLLSILRDQDASAAAKASAGRTILEYFASDETSLAKSRGADMSAAELDAAIAKLGD
jgi:hypothetical protein